MRKVKSEPAQPSTGNSQKSAKYHLVYDFNTLADKRNKINASEYKKKERLDNRSLKYIWCAVSLSSFTQFCFAGFFCTGSL